MVREIKSHRRGPQITGIGPYDPNLAPKPPRKWRGWWVGGVLALVVLLGAGVWFELMRDRPATPPSDLSTVAPEAATGTMEVAETPEEPVVPDLPFGMATGLAAGEEAEAVAQYGNLRIVATTPDYAQEYLGKAAKRYRMDTNAWAAVANLPHTLTNQPCGLVEVALEAEGFRADPASRSVLIQEGRTNDANFALAPLPATLTVTCNVSSAELEIAGIKSQTAKKVSIPSLKPLGLTVASPGWRTQMIKLGSMNPGKAYAKSVTLEREAGALRIEAAVPTNARAFFAGVEKRIRIGTNDWKTVKSLPVVETGLVCKAHPVELQVAGFKVGKGVPPDPLVRDGQTTTVSFALSPLPATLKVSCNVTGAVIQINDQPSTTSNSIPVPALQPLSVTVSATGYVAQVVKLGPMEPGKAYRQEVKLEPVPVAAATGQNSLGMEFVEIPRLACRFSKYETRVKDYEVFAKETSREWPKPDFEQGPDHPAVNVSWDDATAFCVWLTGRERLAGRIKANEVYRLPTDWEWSVAVGLNEVKGGMPLDKDEKTENVYPWGTQWPPPKGTGNHGHSLGVDNYENTSPVGSFTPNANGLYDMAGNVSEWCEDDYYGDQGFSRVLRGASWTDCDPRNRLSSSRGSNSPFRRDDCVGFRVVLSPNPATGTNENYDLDTLLGDIGE